MRIDDEALREFLKNIQVEYGYDFTEYAEASLLRRVTNFMSTKKIVGIDKLSSILLDDAEEFEGFIQHLSVTVTEMFRDPQFYLCIRKKVIKRLATYPLIKIWIAGCATGEEVYSFAILLFEEGLLNRSLIYATDINQNSLKIAKEGVYPITHMKAYTENYQKAGGERSFSEYYKSKYNSVMFDKTLKQNIVFSPHNLSSDKSFNEFQLIICRNVLIYFSQKLQNRVINLFYESLCPFGFLGLGNKESLLFSDKHKFFSDIDRKEKIYIKSK